MEDINKFLTEAMGEQWLGDGSFNNYRRINFSTWEGFGKLWEWAIDQEWWWRFSCSLYYSEESMKHIEKIDCDYVIYERYINPEVFAKALYEFLQKSL